MAQIIPGTDFDWVVLPDGTVLLTGLDLVANDQVVIDETISAPGGISVPVASHHLTKNIGQ